MTSLTEKLSAIMGQTFAAFHTCHPERSEGSPGHLSWRRSKKDELVKASNPEMKDLAVGWYCSQTAGDPSLALGMTG